jgi:hypothetical protein
VIISAAQRQAAWLHKSALAPPLSALLPWSRDIMKAPHWRVSGASKEFWKLGDRQTTQAEPDPDAQRVFPSESLLSELGPSRSSRNLP